MRALPKELVRVIVLIRSPDDLAWRATINDAVAEHGKVLVELFAPLSPEQQIDENFIYLTAEADYVQALSNKICAVIVPDMLQSFSVSDGHERNRLTEITRLLAQAADLPDTTEFFSGADFSHGSIDLFSSLKVSVPENRAVIAGSAFPPRVADLLDIFDDGRPEVGKPYTIDPCQLWDGVPPSDRPSGPMNIDTTGRSRFLAHGPYIFLPKGLWKLKAKVALDQSASQRRYAFHWGGVKQYMDAPIKFDRPGVYEIELFNQTSEPEAAEFRVQLLQASFDGVISILSMQMTLLQRDP